MRLVCCWPDGTARARSLFVPLAPEPAPRAVSMGRGLRFGSPGPRRRLRDGLRLPDPPRSGSAPGRFDGPLARGVGADLRPRADAARLPARDGAFDLYVSFETLEHVDDDRSLLREAKRVLAPGGVFLCSTPNRDFLSPGLTLEDRPRNPYHVREYSIAEFEALLGDFLPEGEALRTDVVLRTTPADPESRRPRVEPPVGATSSDLEPRATSLGKRESALAGPARERRRS